MNVYYLLCLTLQHCYLFMIYDYKRVDDMKRINVEVIW